MQGKAQVIDPREAGRRLPQLTQPVFSEEALARADKTLEAMSGSFEKWLEADLSKLQAARLRAAEAGWTDNAIDAIWRASHDLKGMGGTYGYPLVTQLAASLCRLTETEAGKSAARVNTALVDAHVDGLRAALRDRITSDAHPVGRALVQTLETKVRQLGVAPR
ncbi:MAG TPA: Hpt domain-containing protein [Candidatus Binatia bacterium]|nr:Hpt domain-containing protein [Candidatus Binatia bacterium]